MARGITRTNQLYNVPGRPGILAIGKSALYENFILKDEANPYVPGTNVRRLKLLHIAANATAVFDDELGALIEGLRRCRDSAPAPIKLVGKAKTAKRRRAPRSRPVTAETAA